MDKQKQDKHNRNSNKEGKKSNNKSKLYRKI